MSKEKLTQGVIGILTSGDDVVFLPLPEEDYLSEADGGKGKKERGEEDHPIWTSLKAGMLGFVSGKVKTDQNLKNISEEERKLILENALKREALEEFGLDVVPDIENQEKIFDSGVMEQIRYGKEIKFLLWVVTRLLIHEDQLEELKKAMDVVVVKKDDLLEFLENERENIRPAARQAILKSVDL
ncbi:MAG: hypothetical protein HN981_02845 [Candidatus Pacebacteria bacterium]|jgi:8-oxo-dGTP pyrophosphatase MutT (NUDIX family)|nr:hypothetical protein [Candidatus Paceibacterota bacterium]MBT4652571.1 hypothetical protein [Candidatus Paceibacterota bacterium]MBT6756398.1 hypothetical protein [Candidatus Paceibacterota bacterium]MBT6921308.1 hypothetical protein [Candidatus Paceibacterota bacterium]